MEYIVMPGFINPVSSVKITLSDRKGRSMWDVGDYLPNKLVTSVRDEINDLTWTLDIEQVTSTFDEQKVEQDDDKGAGSRCTENLWVKAFLETRLEGCYKNVGNESHDYGDE